MDDGFLNWGFMPSTTGYILISGTSEYSNVDTKLLKSGSFEEVYDEFSSIVERTHRDWFSGVLEDNLPQEMREELVAESDELIEFLQNTPPQRVKEILEPTELPIGRRAAPEFKVISFSGWDWDYQLGFNFNLRGPYLLPVRYVKYDGRQWVPNPIKEGRTRTLTYAEIEEGQDFDFLREMPSICEYVAEDSMEESYGTNLSLMKL